MQSRTSLNTPATVLAVCLTTIITASILTHAGPLDPPAGPVTPSYKTLTDVEPRTLVNAANTPGDADSVFRITQPGSYYLASNVNCVTAKHGIQIEASNVTLDLNGFAIQGVVGSLDGINTQGSRSSIRIRNGSIRSCGGTGLQLNNSTQTNISQVVSSNNTLDGVSPGSLATLNAVTAADNTRDGFVLGQSFSSTLTDCIADGNNTGFASPTGEVIFNHCIARVNRVDGLLSGPGNRVINCVSAANTGWGFHALGDRALYEGCNAEANGGGGFGIDGYDNVVSRCVARSNRGSGTPSGFDVLGGFNTDFNECVAIFNTRAGFRLTGARPTLRGCTSTENGTAGVDAPGVTARIENCRVDGNVTIGLNLGQNSIVEQTTVHGNNTDGIRLNGNGNGVIRRCQVVGNGAIGMYLVNGSIVEDCTVNSNASYGVSCSTLNTIRRCTFDTNGTAPGNTFASVYCTGGGNLIEDNYIFSGDSGIVITFGGGSIVRRNIVNVTANNYGLIVGGNRVANINTSATLSSINPNDNFSY